MSASSTPRQLPVSTQHLAFSLGEVEYAVELLRVREVLRFSTPTRVPGTMDFIRGVMNLRGNVVPVVDLHLKLGLPRASETEVACIAVVELDGEWGETIHLGVIVDAVTDIIDLGPDDIESPPPFGTTIRLDFLRGLGKAGGRLYVVLDIDRVLSPDELSMALDAREGTP